ncbi:MAG TPA: TetR/AcrR family transcriptional regulator [Jatrophihabitantaceae bacterium]|jgi:AcrR family transcriptional regulator
MTIAPTVASQRKRGAALEDAILEAAYTELSEVGYTAFTVEGVAARARTGKASIYRRWPTRDELLLDAVCAYLPTPQECGLGEIPADLSTADALRGVARAISTVISSPAGDVMRAIKCEAATNPELARAIDDRFQAPRREFLVRLLRRGVERGEVRPGADTALVADVLPAVLTHRILLQREPITPKVITDIIEQIVLPLVAPH